MHGMRALFLAFLAGCATMGSQPASPPPPSATAEPAGPPAPADATPEERDFAADYEAAVDRAEKDDLAGAYDLLARRGAALETAGRFDLAGICWNTTTWVKWAQGDLAGALAENAKLGQALTRAEPEARADLYLHYLWDRAYLLRDQADRAAAADKAGALAQAEAARAEYVRAATAAEADGLAVLEAYFAWRSRDTVAATAAARRVDLVRDQDAQDLYIVALVLEEAGDAKTAADLRARIEKAHYMMPPLLRHWAETSSAR